MVFKSVEELRTYILSRCEAAVVEVEEKVYRIIDEHLDKFYGEFTPAEYIRTKQLLHSLVRTGVKQVGTSFVAEVYFDASKLNYQTGVIPLKSGRTGYATWSGGQVLETAMQSGLPHGGYAGGTAIWGESLTKLGNIYILLVQALEANGIPVK